MRQFLGLVVAAALPIGFLSPACAQVQRSFVNLSFEEPNLVGNPCRVFIDDTEVPGWVTTHSTHADETNGRNCIVPPGFGHSNGHIIELWRGPRAFIEGLALVAAPDGQQFAELNAEEPSRIYQSVCLLNGRQLGWRFAHRGRASDTDPDRMQMKIGALGTVVEVGTTNSGTFVTPVVYQGSIDAPVKTGDGTWVRYSGRFTYTGPTGNTNIGFEAVSTSNGDVAYGNFLDDIQITLVPFVDFAQPSSSTPENATENPPRLRVNGEVPAPFSVIINVVGGDATLEQDFDTPDGRRSFAVTVPAGHYDGVSDSSFIALPVQIDADADVEGIEHAIFEIEPPSAPPDGSLPPFYLASSDSCGGRAQTTWDWEILDDDVDAIVAKNLVDITQVDRQPGVFDLSYSVRVTNPSDRVAASYGLVDRPGFDPDATILSVSFTRNDGASQSLAATPPQGGWVLQAPYARLAPLGTDLYVVNVRVRIERTGSTADDLCTGQPGHGLYNYAIASVQVVAFPNKTPAASGCVATPTPAWVSLTKRLADRAAAGDQATVNLYSGGILAATGTTSGSSANAQAGTGIVVVPAGATVQFTESMANGGSDVQGNYVNSLSCTNSTTGTVTTPPSGGGTALGTLQVWPAFAVAAGDNIGCIIANAPAVASADLAIVKTVTPENAYTGETVTYTLQVTNSGPSAANGATVRDPRVNGIDCTAAMPACTSAGGAACPASLTIGALQSADGVAVPTLPVGGSLQISYSCKVTASGVP